MVRGRWGAAVCLARVALAVGVALGCGAVTAVVTRAAGGRVLGLATAYGACLLGWDAARFKDLHLALGELAPRALGHALELKAGKVAAMQTDYRMVNLA